MKVNKVFLTMMLAVAFLDAFAVYNIVGVSAAQAANGIVSCGRGQSMCTLCDLIAGMNNIIQYLMKISIGVALLAMSIGGVMYVVSAGDSKLIDQAKGTMKNAAIGFVIIFAGWLIINTTITYIGTKTITDNGGTLGINVTSWGQFDCNRTVPVSN
jgi:hypothetical protein